jgi:3-hydroxyisobutyrate dehydrogenase-like beta-hydroxyacid dehydrogenase
MTPRVGFIGLGNIGEPMAVQVAQAGFDLTVFDIRPEPVARLVAVGAKEADSIVSLAQHCDVVLVAVVNDKQVSDILLGGSDSLGVLSAAKPGSTVVLHSTVHPDTCRALSSTAVARQIDLLDAPVSGGPRGAQTGSLSIMVGGPESALNRCRAVLLAMGDHVTHIGDSGTGQIAKIANNVALSITMRAVHEALALAETNGVSPEAMRQLLTWGAANSWVAENWSAIGNTVANYQAGGAQGVANLTFKDLSFALSIAHDHLLALPATAVTAQVLADPYRSAEIFVTTSPGSSADIATDDPIEPPPPVPNSEDGHR